MVWCAQMEGEVEDVSVEDGLVIATTEMTDFARFRSFLAESGTPIEFTVLHLKHVMHEATAMFGGCGRHSSLFGLCPTTLRLAHCVWPLSSVLKALTMLWCVWPCDAVQR